MPATLSKADQAAADILTTAVEGGTNYWAAVSKLRRDDDLNVLSVNYHAEDDDGEGYVAEGVPVDLAGVKRAMRKVADGDVRHVRDEIVRQARGLLRGDEDVDFDADTADTIVQVAIFGEVVYG